MLTLQFILGTIFGSFLLATHARRARHESILVPARSKCDACLETIDWYHLIPIVSYLLLRGHCKWCGNPIGISALLSEIYFGVLAACWIPTISASCQFIIGSLLFLMALEDHHQLQFSAKYCWFMMAVVLIGHFLTQPHDYKVLAILVVWLALQMIDWQPRYIGNGDLDILLCLLMLHGLITLAWLLLLSSATALTTSLIVHRRRLAFVPFITISYLILLLYHTVN